MRLSLEWLGEFIDLPADAELCERLEMCGFEDVTATRNGPDLSGICVGHVVERGAHPNADRLSVCRVDLGEGEPHEVVCGAPNVEAGQKIAFAPVGTELPDGTRLKKAKIRGVRSNGMICSERELGLGESHEGILVLDAGAPVGAAIDTVLPTPDRELDLTITPNRGDAASLLGLAREVRALFGGDLRIPQIEPVEAGAPAADAVNIAIEAPEDCHRYVARIVRGVSIGPSPDWLVAKLAASGIRAINNVVDITNLVLLEFGQPLHAFDRSALRGDTVSVRRATAGEKIVTLDGETRELDPEDLVIADEQGAIALAGVMGGAGSEVGDSTTDLLIESAHFEPKRVRLGARRHGLRTEASYRFERGVDRAGVERAADRAARLMAELAGGEVASGRVVAEGAPVPHTSEIRYASERTNRLLGTSLSQDEIRGFLARVGVESQPAGTAELACAIPSHRNDLHRHQDLTEEVARVFGYENIPTTHPVARLQGVRPPPNWSLADRVRDALVAAGLVECQTYPFVREDGFDALRLPADDPRRSGLRINNPFRDEEPLMRTTLVPSALRLVHQNRSRQVDRIELFEVSSLFGLPEGRSDFAEGLPSERVSLVVALAARQNAQLWDPAGAAARPFFRAKGIAKKLLIQLGYVAWFPRDPIPPYLHPGSAAAIGVGTASGGRDGSDGEGTGSVIGAVGELHPSVASAFDIDVECALIEIDLSALLEMPRSRADFVEVSRQPSVARDVAVVVDAAQPSGELLDAVRSTAGKDLVSVELFDRYEGQGVPEGRISLAFRMVFQRADRTLKDAEVTKATDRVVRMLAHRFGGELR
jgi:phenylalanyl-tRNA synthetase beta chain